MKEVWKDISGYEGSYQVSNLGRVKGLDRFVGKYNEFRKGVILKPQKDKEGYCSIRLCKKGKSKAFLIHRLVGYAFIKNVKNLPFINHKDENKENNIYSNLEWCTRKYNNNYGTRSVRAGLKCRKKVAKYDFDGNLLEIYDSVLEAKQKNSKSLGTHISEVCNGKRKSAYGFIWKYYND